METEPGIAKLTTYASKEATDLGALYVNSKGKRIVNESAVYTDFRDAILQQPDRIAYMLMDERTWKEVYKLLVLHDFTEKEIKQFFDNKDKKPLFVKGSLKDVAQAANVDVASLEETVKNYQGYAKDGKDQNSTGSQNTCTRLKGIPSTWLNNVAGLQRPWAATQLMPTRCNW